MQSPTMKMTPSKAKAVLAARNVEAKRGQYSCGLDDRLDGWYLVHIDDYTPDYTGRGFRTLADAAAALLRTEEICREIAERQHTVSTK